MNPKMELPVAEWKSALTGLGKVVSKHAALPVLSHIRVQRNHGGNVSLAGTDLDTYATARFTTEQKGEPLDCLVPLETLVQIVKGCGSTDRLGLEQAAAAEVIVHCPVGRSFVTRPVASLPVAEFPPFPSVEGEEAHLGDAARTAFLQAMACASTDASRYVLRSVFLDVSKKKAGDCIVATDGRHAYVANSFEFPGLKESRIIPSGKFLEWSGFVQDGDWKLSVKKPSKKNGTEWVQIRSDRWCFITKAVEGVFPNWRQVMPSARDLRTGIDFSETAATFLLEVLPKLPGNELPDRGLGLAVAGTRLTLLARSDPTEKWTEVEVAGVQVRGSPGAIHLNRGYVLKALRFGFRKVEWQDALSPLLFSSQGKQMVVMPLRMDDPKIAAAPATPATPPHPENPDPAPTGKGTPSIPASSTEAAKQPTTADTKGTPMTTTVEPGKVETNGSSLHAAITQIETVKDALRGAIANLHALAESLKKAQREQKSAEREVEGVRATLKTLQRVKL